MKLTDSVAKYIAIKMILNYYLFDKKPHEFVLQCSAVVANNGFVDSRMCLHLQAEEYGIGVATWEGFRHVACLIHKQGTWHWVLFNEVVIVDFDIQRNDCLNINQVKLKCQCHFMWISLTAKDWCSAEPRDGQTVMSWIMIVILRWRKKNQLISTGLGWGY